MPRGMRRVGDEDEDEETGSRSAIAGVQYVRAASRWDPHPILGAADTCTNFEAFLESFATVLSVMSTARMGGG